KQDQVEAILRVEVFQHIGRSFTRLIPLLPAHTPGLVKYHDHILWDHALIFDAQGRLDQQHKEAIIPSTFAVGQQVEVDRVTGDTVKKAEVAVRNKVVRFESGPEGFIRIRCAADGNVVAGRIDTADGVVATHVNGDAHLFDGAFAVGV